MDDMRTQATGVMFRNFEQFNQAFMPFASKKVKHLVFKPRYFEGEEKWYASGLDDHLWEDSVTLGPWGCDPWGTPAAAGDGAGGGPHA